MPENPQMEALDIFDFSLMPDSQEQWDKVKGTYGDKEIEVLIEHFGQSRQQYTRVSGSRIERLVDPIEVRVEWSVMKGQLFKLKMQQKKPDDGYNELLKDLSVCPHVKYLLCVHLVLCLSTVWCERGFSAMARIKTKLQNKMNTPTLGARMMVYSNGPALTDENESALTQIFEETLQYWSTLQKRMPARSHPGVSRPKHKKTDSVPLHDLLRGGAPADMKSIPKVQLIPAKKWGDTEIAERGRSVLVMHVRYRSAGLIPHQRGWTDAG